MKHFRIEVDCRTSRGGKHSFTYVEGGAKAASVVVRPKDKVSWVFSRDGKPVGGTILFNKAGTPFGQCKSLTAKAGKGTVPQVVQAAKGKAFPYWVKLAKGVEDDPEIRIGGADDPGMSPMSYLMMEVSSDIRLEYQLKYQQKPKVIRPSDWVVFVCTLNGEKIGFKVYFPKGGSPFIGPASASNPIRSYGDSGKTIARQVKPLHLVEPKNFPFTLALPGKPKLSGAIVISPRRAAPAL